MFKVITSKVLITVYLFMFDPFTPFNLTPTSLLIILSICKGFFVLFAHIFASSFLNSIWVESYGIWLSLNFFIQHTTFKGQPNGFVTSGKKCHFYSW